MTPDVPQPPPEDREARLTALLLGELPTHEAESLRAGIAADPELARRFDRLRVASELTRDTLRESKSKELARAESMQLSPERRAALLARFRQAPANAVPLPEPLPAPAFNRRELLALAAMLVALLGAGAVVFPSWVESFPLHAPIVRKASRASSITEFTAGLSPESLPEKAGHGPTPAPGNLELWEGRPVPTPDRKRVEDEIARSIPQESPRDPVLAKRYGLSPAPAGGFEVDRPAATQSAPNDAGVAMESEAKQPVAAGDVTRSLSLAKGMADSSRPTVEGSKSSGLTTSSGGLAGADFNSRFMGRLASNGRGGDVVRGQIVLPEPEPRQTREDTSRPATDSFFAQAPPQQGLGVGAGGGGAAGTQWHFTQAPNTGGAFGNGLAANLDGATAPTAGATAVLAQDGRQLIEQDRLDDAEVKLKQSLKSDPGGEKAVENLGMIRDRRYLESSQERGIVSKDKPAQVEHAWAAGTGLGGGAGNRLNFGGFQPAPPPPAPSQSVGLAVAPNASLADGAVRELGAPAALPGSAGAPEPLGRMAGRNETEDRRSAVARSEAFSLAKLPPGTDAPVDVAAAAPAINGPESSRRSRSTSGVGEAIREFDSSEVRFNKANADGLVDALSVTKSELTETLAQADKQLPNLIRETQSRATVTGFGDLATPVPPDVTTLSRGDDFGRKAGAERVPQPADPAGSVLEGRAESEKKLADLSAGYGLAVAGKPAAVFGYAAPPTTNAAPLAFGDQPVLGTAFGTQWDARKSSGVEIIETAIAESGEKPGLFAKLRQTLGGDTTRTVRIKIEKDTPDIGLLGSAFGTQPTYDPYYLLTEQEVIRSRKILGEVAKRLNFSTEAEAEEGFRQLEGKVSVHQFRNTAIAEIQVKDPDPAKAASIANTVAQVYAEYRDSLPTGRSGRKMVSQLTDKPVQAAQPPPEAPASDSDKPLPKLAPGAPEPQPEFLTAENAFSTFSLNVSDVSFKLAAASLEKGQMPDPTTVRTEEFINAFDYRDPEPVGAAPISFTWERARYPFAHDRDLLRFSVKTAASGRQSGRPLNLVLLLDNSGSMERADRVRIRQECLRVLAGQLQPQDRVSVVAFARSARLWVDGLPGTQAAELPGRVGELTPDGGTNLEEALRLAYQTAARHFTASGVNRVVLLTDGAANLGDVQPESLKQQVEANRRQGIALDCFGIGWDGFNDELLEVLSRNGDGRYGFVNTPEAATSEFADQLVGALQVAASDVKVQVEWNPRRVTASRQLGYAKHQLTKEQFRDNTVDAAEIGAAEAGNALYIVQVNPAGEGPLGTVRVRFRVPGTGDYREHEWPLNYSGTAGLLEQAGPALRLAGSASAFSEWLVSSPHAAEVSPDRLLGLLTGVSETYAADPRPKQFEQMLQQAKSLSGK